MRDLPLVSLRTTSSYLSRVSVGVSCTARISITTSLEPGLFEDTVVTKMAHFHQLEVPEQVNAMIERFLAIGI